MTTILFLFLIGIVMVLLEVFLPGGVLGLLGAAAMIAGCVLSFRDYGVGGGIVSIVAGLVLFGAGLVLEFKILPKTKVGKSMFLSAAVSGTSTNPAVGADLIGRECEAATVLAPSGVVLIDGRRLEAFCRDGYAELGSRLIIRGSESFRLIVSKS